MSIPSEGPNYLVEQLAQLSLAVDLAKKYEEITRKSNIQIDETLIKSSFDPIIADARDDNDRDKLNNIISMFPKQIFLQPALPELGTYYDRILDINEIIDDIDDSIFSKNFQTEIMPFLRGLPNALTIVSIRTNLIDLLEYSKKTGDVDSDTLTEINNVFNEINTAFEPIYNILNSAPTTAAATPAAATADLLKDISPDTLTKIQKKIESIKYKYANVQTPFTSYFNNLDIQAYKGYTPIKQNFFDTTHIAGIIGTIPNKIDALSTFGNFSIPNGAPGGGTTGAGTTGGPPPGGGGANPPPGGGTTGGPPPHMESEGPMGGGSYKKTIKQRNHHKSKSHTMRNKHKRK